MKSPAMTKNAITEGTIWKQLLLFFFPILLGTFFQQLYNTIDSVIVGQFVGKEALASVGGSSAQIVALVVGFFTGLSSGASVTIAQFFGARNEKAANQGLHNAYALAATGGVLLTAAGILCTPSLLSLMRTPADTMADSIIYLRIYFAGILFVLVYNMGSAILRATGDSRRPLYYLIICCVINIVLDCLFVIVFHMGVMGAAVATLIAQAVSAVLVTRDLIRSRDLLHLSLRDIRFHGAVLKTQLKMGIPTGLESVLFSITNIAIMAAINTFGTDTTAAWSAYGKLDAIFWMVSTAFGIAITTFVGQNYGAGRMDRVRRSTRVCLLIDLAVSGILVLFLIAAREILFRMFTTDPDVIRIGCNMLILIIPWYIVYVIIEVLAGGAAGHRGCACTDGHHAHGCLRIPHHLAFCSDAGLTNDPGDHLQLSGDLDRQRACFYCILYPKIQTEPHPMIRLRLISAKLTVSGLIFCAVFCSAAYFTADCSPPHPGGDHRWNSPSFSQTSLLSPVPFSTVPT